MTAREQTRKEKQRCTRCGVELTDADTTSLCTPHQHDQNRRTRESLRRLRSGQRTMTRGVGGAC